MTHEQELREIAQKLENDGWYETPRKLRHIACELEALKAREPMTDYECGLALKNSMDDPSPDFMSGFYSGISCAEAHHNITSKE